MEVRIAALEKSVGDNASCVRNLTNSSGVKGCVHPVNLSGTGSFSVCGRRYQERPHVRVPLEQALNLPAQQRCDRSSAQEGSVSSDTGIQPSHHPEDSGLRATNSSLSES